MIKKCEVKLDSYQYSFEAGIFTEDVKELIICDNDFECDYAEMILLHKGKPVADDTTLEQLAELKNGIR